MTKAPFVVLFDFFPPGSRHKDLYTPGDSWVMEVSFVLHKDLLSLQQNSWQWVDLEKSVLGIPSANNL